MAFYKKIFAGLLALPYGGSEMLCRSLFAVLFTVLLFPGFSGNADAQGKPMVKLSQSQVEDIVRRSYQYVAMYNVNNKFAMDPNNPSNTGGWNKVKVNTALFDHNVKAIARPNNDTLYIGAMLDLRAEPMILEVPEIDSKYVSLMVTGYDHYVNVPMSTQAGDFSKPSRIMFYTKRTKHYDGAKPDGVDKVIEATGDFVSAVYRVMPHANEPDRFKRNIEAMKAIKVMTLSEYKSGGKAGKKFSSAKFPKFGKTDFDTFGNNLLEAMQFVFNHTTFDAGNKLDAKLLEIYKPLGVVPGQSYDPKKVARIDGALFRKVAQEIAKSELAKASDPEFKKRNELVLFQPKGKMTLETLLFQSVVGPIGLPASEALYVPVQTKAGSPMEAKHDHVIRMKKSELPPAKAFWSATLYDMKNGFFIPNDRKKYSIGENAGFKLDDKGGIEIYIAEKQPEGVPEENWLPINRGDYELDLQMRIYAPDIKGYKKWTPPKAETVK